MTISAFDHPLLAGLVGDAAVARAFSFDTELRAMLDFEAALARAEAAEGVIPGAAAKAIGKACTAFKPDGAALAEGARRDGMVVPNLVRQLRAAVGEPHAVHVHHGATSQDVIDTALVLRIKPLLAEFAGRVQALHDALFRLADAEGRREIIGRTRMQRALPIRLGERIATWSGPLLIQGERLRDLLPSLLVLQFGGPVGNRAALGDKGDAVARRLASELGLGLPENVWHATRSRIAELAGWLSQVTGGLGKMGQDLAIMAQNEIGEVRFRTGGGSSAMAHKSNPVAAEVLVALARFNATQISGVHHALVHEAERSGTAWTLEWLILPSMLAATGGALRLAAEMVDDLEFPEAD